MPGQATDPIFGLRGYLVFNWWCLAAAVRRMTSGVQLRAPLPPSKSSAIWRDSQVLQSQERANDAWIFARGPLKLDLMIGFAVHARQMTRRLRMGTFNFAPAKRAGLHR